MTFVMMEPRSRPLKDPSPRVPITISAQRFRLAKLPIFSAGSPTRTATSAPRRDLDNRRRVDQGFHALRLMMARDNGSSHEQTGRKGRLHIEHVEVQLLITDGTLDHMRKRTERILGPIDRD